MYPTCQSSNAGQSRSSRGDKRRGGCGFGYLGCTEWRDKSMIQKRIEDQYYILDFAIDEIRPKYRFDASCQGSVPQAIEAFLESENFEDTIRIAVSLGGDSDTIAAIAGGIAGAYYGVPNDLRLKAIEYLPAEFIDILEDFEKNYC